MELANETKPQLRIGASSVPSLYFLPELLSAYHAVHPDIRVYASCSDSLDVVHKVDDGICDIGLVGTTTSDTSCEFLPFASDELVIGRPRHATLSGLPDYAITAGCPLKRTVSAPGR